MALKVERISAVTFRVSNMNASVQFYRDVLGMEVLYGAEELRGSLPCVRKTRTLPSSIWSRVSGSTAGVGLSSMWRMWTRALETLQQAGIRARTRAECFVGRTVFPIGRSAWTSGARYLTPKIRS